MIRSSLARLLFAISLLGLLSGCVQPTPYQPAPPQGFGYSEDRIEQNRFRITFRGNSITTRETVEDYLLYRAAELTLQNGFDHFLMVGRDTEAKTSYRYWVDLYGGRGYFYHGFPRWHYERQDDIDASKVKVENVGFPLREPMLAAGEVDAITGFSFTSLLNLEARGVKAEDIVVLSYPEHGVKLYGNVIIATPKLIKENPAAVKAFIAAFLKGAKEVMANPDAAIEYVKARDGIIDVNLEKRRLRMAIDAVVASPDARAEGFGVVNGGRLSLMASQVSDAFGTKTRVDPTAAWTDAFVPSKAELNILPPAKK